MKTAATYRIELHCNHPEWWCYNVVMTARGFDSEGAPAGFFATSDTIAPIDGTDHPKPTDYPTTRTTRLECSPCHRLELYLYVLPHRLPAENAIDHTPSFEAELRILDGRTRLHTQKITINPWGGTTLHLQWPMSNEK